MKNRRLPALLLVSLMLLFSSCDGNEGGAVETQKSESGVADTAVGTPAGQEFDSNSSNEEAPAPENTQGAIWTPFV